MELELFLFQEEDIRFASEREGALIADEMGLGKSIQAIGVINEDPTIRKVIIVITSENDRINWPLSEPTRKRILTWT
jgi:SNF2 family DNA or RNA helicase